MTRLDSDVYDFHLKELLNNAEGGHVESVRKIAQIAWKEVSASQDLHPIVMKFLANGLSEIAAGGLADHGFLIKRKGKRGRAIDLETNRRQIEIAQHVADYYEQD